MTCNACTLNLRQCQCPNVKKQLRELAASRHVYVGNIIEERFASGLSQPIDFDGLNIHHPMKDAGRRRGCPQAAARRTAMSILCIGGPHDGRRVDDFGDYYRCPIYDEDPLRAISIRQPPLCSTFKISIYYKRYFAFPTKSGGTKIGLYIFAGMEPMEAFQLLCEHYQPLKEK